MGFFFVKKIARYIYSNTKPVQIGRRLRSARRNCNVWFEVKGCSNAEYRVWGTAKKTAFDVVRDENKRRRPQ